MHAMEFRYQVILSEVDIDSLKKLVTRITEIYKGKRWIGWNSDSILYSKASNTTAR